MRKLIWIISLLGLIGLSGCAGESAEYKPTNTNAGSSNKPPNSPLPTATPVVKSSESNVTREDYDKSKSANSMKSANSTKQANTTGSGNTASSGNSNKPITPPTTAEKPKEEGLFSFPPPRPTDITEISAGDLLAVKGQTTLAQVSERLAGSLEKAGYQKNKYSYFWNDRDEFAIVTSMERVNFDGSNFTENNRWVRNAKDKALPTAAEGSYFKYLIQGKKVYYRVFAFIVTPSRNRQNLNRGDPPEFATAVNWKGKGEPELGNGETTTVESVVWTEKYKCFALVYLFVNHTSLDLPKSVDSLDDSELRLQNDLVREAEAHIKNIRANLGDK